ncbi:MAG: hypothetical protein K1X67_12045 [Fimbriimonadaceae bacterium]|nr:hypothetical protein [Fimbriimonadaceae bacterium]
MKRFTIVCILASGVFSGMLVLSSGVESQPQAKGLVVLQPTTPGFPQLGHVNITGTQIAGSFQGNGSLLTALDAGAITTGTLSDLRLSANIARLNGNQSFTGKNTFSNLGNIFIGNGSGLTNLDASNVSSGTLLDSRLSSNVATLAGTQIFTGAKTFNVAATFAAAGPPFNVSSSILVPNLNADMLDGLHSSAFLSSTAPLYLTATLPSSYVIHGKNTSNADSSIGVRGWASATSGSVVGVFGRSDSTEGRAVEGYASSATGQNIAVMGTTASSQGYAAYFQGKSYFSTNVGIATLTPATALDVNGIVRADRYEDRQNPAYYIDPGNGTNAAILWGRVGINTVAPVEALQVEGDIRCREVVDTDNTLYWMKLAGSGGTSAVMAGRVAIGTTSASYKLHVEGDVYASDGIKTGTAASGGGTKFGHAKIASTGTFITIYGAELAWDSVNRTVTLEETRGSYCHYSGNKDEGAGGAFIRGYITPNNTLTLATLNSNGECIQVEIAPRDADSGYIHLYGYYDNGFLVVNYTFRYQ